MCGGDCSEPQAKTECVITLSVLPALPGKSSSASILIVYEILDEAALVDVVTIRHRKDAYQ